MVRSEFMIQKFKDESMKPKSHVNSLALEKRFGDIQWDSLQVIKKITRSKTISMGFITWSPDSWLDPDLHFFMTQRELEVYETVNTCHYKLEMKMMFTKIWTGLILIPRNFSTNFGRPIGRGRGGGPTWKWATPQLSDSSCTTISKAGIKINLTLGRWLVQNFCQILGFVVIINL